MNFPVESNRQSGVNEIDLLAILWALWRKAWIIILVMVFMGGAAFSYAYLFVSPLYEAQALFYVNNSSFSVGSTSVSISSSELTAAQSLVDTYIVILHTRSTLSEVIKEAGVGYSCEDLSKMISANAVNSTEVFSVTVTSDDPVEAEHIANAVARVLPAKISDVVDGSDVRIVDYAVIPTEKVSPSLTMYTLNGLIIGLVVSCLLIILMEAMDEQIHSEDYLLKNYDAPLLAVIPDMLNEKSSAGHYIQYIGNAAKKK